ncbi:GlcG/HbpS family heme-binding protein [Govanella unica]|uniref:Heme-binding protein n=1 Tax=Govanella unica TaxID=2975056 RepID=A0A9X3TZ46_9PROT|nr:heme-binding protein [Govania unica]MDA5194441.1 heme-binding protein [Govania unica]
MKADKMKTGRGFITLEQASVIVDAALAHGRTRSLPPLTVAVLDVAGRLVAFKREDNSSLLRPEIAQAKAWGALAMGSGSRALGERAKTHPEFISAITALAGGNLIPVAGGVLIYDQTGILLGAVGISGALPDQDEDCALKGIAQCDLVAEVGSSH